MSFIPKEDAIIINTKLTNIGRLLLASGALTFSKIEFGDSEINYNFLRDNDVLDGSDNLILRPKDLNPQIKYPIQISETTTGITKSDINFIRPIEVPVYNTANERGFFDGNSDSGFTAFTSTDYILGYTRCITSAVTGNTILRVDSSSAMSVGNMILVDWRNPSLDGNVFPTGSMEASLPRQFQWYKVLAINSNNITIDRALPNFGNAGTSKSFVYIFPTNDAIKNYYSTGTTVSYWNDNTLAFNSNCNIANDDVLVWNFNIVYNQTPAGVTNLYTNTYYSSSTMLGLHQLLYGSSAKSTLQQIGVIHFTNNSISNYYGEGFKLNTFRVDLPTVMYHKKTGATMGISLKAYGTKQSKPTNISNFLTEYYNLVEETSLRVVGRVFNDLKLAVIEDQDILNALSLKGGRSHTLPKPNYQIVTPTTTEITNSNVLLTSSANYLAITYKFTNNASYDASKNYGFDGGIHCGYIEKLYYTGPPGANVQFNWNLDELKFMKDQFTISDGTGFNANGISIITQLVNSGEEPDPTQWKIFDYTSKINNALSWGSTTMDPSDLANGVYRFTYSDYTASTTYDMSTYLPTPSDLNSLGFGSESILLGNVNADIKAIVYKTQIVQKLDFNEYNISSNPTWDTDDDIYVTETGIYDINNNLVAIGKLNYPIKKNKDKLFTLELDMDF